MRSTIRRRRSVSIIQIERIEPRMLFSAASSISGTLFNDINHDGVQDAEEGGIPNVTVYNDNTNDGSFLPGDPTTTTDSAGHYTLPQLTAGNYKIRQDLPAGWKQTVPTKNFGWTVSVGTNQQITGKNFADESTVPPQSLISGTIFHDINGNGRRDAGDFGIAYITVYDDANNNGRLDPAETTTLAFTDSSGAYNFSDLPAGHYKLRAIFSPSSVQTTPANGFGQTFNLATNQVLTGKNFGELSAAITGTLFNDTNGNGMQDTNENPLSGWTLYIDSNNDGRDQGELQIQTANDGAYYFTGLAPGTYIVRMAHPTGWSQSIPIHNLGQHITVTAAQTRTGVSFGARPVSV